MSAAEGTQISTPVSFGNGEETGGQANLDPVVPWWEDQSTTPEKNNTDEKGKYGENGASDNIDAPLKCS